MKTCWRGCTAPLKAPIKFLQTKQTTAPTGGKTMLGQDVGFDNFGEAMRLEVYVDGLFLKSKAADGTIRSILVGQHNSGLTVDVNDFKWLTAFAGTAFADTITHSGSSNMIINGLDGNDSLTGCMAGMVMTGCMAGKAITGWMAAMAMTD